MSTGRTLKLNSGYDIPVIGLGTWQSGPNEVSKAVEAALRCGYRHIDAAACYGNEAEVGEGIRASGVPRSEIFITSKLWNTHHREGDVEKGLDMTLQDLGTDYVDLYLIHFPVAFKLHEDPRNKFPVNPATGALDTIDVSDEETWRGMEAMVKKGKAKSIGVSNFTRERIEKLMKTATIKPACNQIEAHPYLQQPALHEWLKKEGIVSVGYSSSGNNIYGLPKAVDDPVVIEIAKKLGKDPNRVLVQWSAQRGSCVLPKSVTPSRIQDNFQDFTVPEEDMAKINSLDRQSRYNFPARFGVDIFGEHSKQFLEEAVRDWVAKQKASK